MSSRPSIVFIERNNFSLKRLHEPVIAKIDEGSSSFWAAKNRSTSEPNGLGLLERQRVKVWLKHAYGELARIGA